MGTVNLVTGSSSGIGHAICNALLARGESVIGLARDHSRMPIVHDNFTATNIDFADIAALPQRLEQLTQQHPRIDNLICCAGYGQFGSLEEFSCEQINRLMTVNFTSQACVTRAIIPVMKKANAGKIIFIGSEAARQGRKFGTIYCASKFALRGMAQALREECNTRNIAVTIVNPGMVRSEFYDGLSFQPGEAPENYLTRQDVATTILQILDTPGTMVIDEINLSPLKKVIRSKD
jgi:NADP-dependent 3-hydroxy acid dehydrogenase YdfG